MAFPTPEEAHAFCRNLGLRGARRIGDGDDGDGEFEPLPIDADPPTYVFAWQDGEHVSLAWALEHDPEGGPLTTALFARGHYYGGCGELYRIHVRTLPIGAPVVPWDFD